MISTQWVHNKQNVLEKVQPISEDWIAPVQVKNQGQGFKNLQKVVAELIW